jgi:TRAP-type mannitol/chloroaromatic compound transport system permease small subunit
MNDRLRRRIKLVVVGVLLLLVPALILVATLGFLLVAEGLVLGELSLLELLELYVIELLLIAAIAYALYRLLGRSIRRVVLAPTGTERGENDDTDAGSGAADRGRE